MPSVADANSQGQGANPQAQGQGAQDANSQGQDVNSQAQDANLQAQDANLQAQDANSQGQDVNDANPQAQDADPQAQDADSQDKKPLCSDPKVAERMRQLKWDVMALADSFGWTDQPAQFIPPSMRPTRWASPTEPARRQKELAEYLAKKRA